MAEQDTSDILKIARAINACPDSQLATAAHEALTKVSRLCTGGRPAESGRQVLADMGEPFEVVRLGHRLEVELWYPDYEPRSMTVAIGMYHVRATDGFRTWYDFDRDGWVIEQNVWTDEDETGAVWREAAFVRSWQFDETSAHD